MSNVASHPTLDAATRELLRLRISEARRERLAPPEQKSDTCPVCGVELVRGPKAGHKVYCSRRCNEKAYYHRRQQRLMEDPVALAEFRQQRKKWREGRPVSTKPCAVCGAEVASGRRKFCSHACKNKDWRSRHPEYRAVHAHRQWLYRKQKREAA